MSNPFDYHQRLTMLLASCGYPKDCPFCLAPIRVMRHLVGADVNYDFAGPNEGSPHECEMEQLKRGILGVYHSASAKHLDRYVQEFAFRLNEGNVSRHTFERLDEALCSDCPPVGYPTDETRCDACPRCLPLCPDSPDGNHHVAPIGSDEEWMPSKAPCYYCGDKQAL